MAAEGKKILVIDDEEDVVTYLVTLLEDNGYKTVSAKDGNEAIEAVKEILAPLATVFTPNLPEASEFLNFRICSPEDMQNAAIQLASWGARSILLKGGHLEGSDSTDLFYICPEDRFIVLKAERVDTRNDHGTGCTLSSAIASYLAKAFPLERAVRNAKEYLIKAIRAGAEYEIGIGHGPVHHFFEFW